MRTIALPGKERTMSTGETVEDSVRHLQQGRPSCFIIMSYREEYDHWYADVSKFIENELGLLCRRADRHQGSGMDLLAKVHAMILHADVVIAEISEESPNVYYEYGFAMAHRRPPILVARKGVVPPTDLRGIEFLPYEDGVKADAAFRQKLKEVVQARLRTPVPELRKMLEPIFPFPTYMLAAPRVPGAGSRHWWHPDETTTFGDNEGIRGLFSAFGNIFGTSQMPELLHAEYVPDSLFAQDANFFLIGSPKVNPGTEHFLRAARRQWVPEWYMAQTGKLTDCTMTICGPDAWANEYSRPVERKMDDSVDDYGLLIRMPHPRHPTRLVMMMMGRHSIGTGAACLAATSPGLITRIRDALASDQAQLEIKSIPFWALVCGTMNKEGQVHAEAVRLVACGRYRPSDRTAPTS